MSCHLLGAHQENDLHSRRLAVRNSLCVGLGVTAGSSSSAESTVGQANRGTRQYRYAGPSVVASKLAPLFRLFAAGCLALAIGPISSGAETGFKHCGLYVHACWLYNYPFATRTWNRPDYGRLFRLLKTFGYDEVMLWPMLEAIPSPLSADDAEALRGYRPIIENAHREGLECWLTLSLCTTDEKIAEKPWPKRNFYAVRKDVRLDDPAEREAWLKHQAAMLAILNDADAYVTIDSDPGGYPGAKAEDFLRVFQDDRRTIDRVGVRPRSQKIMPWIWGGWGMKGWEEPAGPRLARLAHELEVYKSAMKEGWELMPGRNGGDYGCGRLNMPLAEKAGLMPASTLMFYDSIEGEPSVPHTKLQFDDIRRALRQERQYASRARGCFGNCQTAILQLPNIYFFVRAARDPRYLDRPDGAVLADFARLLGGPPELLVPTWSCLRLRLDQLPAELPAKLRQAELTGQAAQNIPGGPRSYLNILAAEVDSHRRLLEACRGPAKSEQEAAGRLADGVRAMVDWWTLHRYTFDRDAKAFSWDYVWGSESGLLRQWARQNKHWPNLVRLAAQRLAREGILPRDIAQARVVEVMK